MSAEFADVAPMETSAPDAPVAPEAEVVDAPVAPESVRFALTSRGQAFEVAREKWEAIPEDVRGSLESFLRGAEGTDESLRAVTGKLDATRAEMQKLDVERIRAEERAKTLAEVGIRPQPMEQPDPLAQYDTPTIIRAARNYTAEASRAYARGDAQAGDDFARKATEISGALERRIANENAAAMRYRQEQERAATEHQNRYFQLAVEAGLRVENDAFYADQAQRLSVPKTVIERAAQVADDILRKDFGVEPSRVMAENPDLRKNLIVRIAGEAKAGIGSPSAAQGQGAVPRVDPRGLPTRASGSAGMAPPLPRATSPQPKDWRGGLM